MRRPCLGCGRLIASGSRCRRCTPKRKRATPGRGTGWTAEKFRRAVLARTGGRCAVCGSSEGVEAHHRRPLADGGGNDPANGVALCRRHHREAEAALRARKRRRHR
jgi:5-methylcytosine-specific restriction endonuclease McrA